MERMTLGPPQTYIPVVRKPWDDPRTCIGGGAVGFVRVEDGEEFECPIIETAAEAAGDHR